ncbi:MAG: DUF4230 domain-containing protein [Frankia sp.]|nr:DUF4230 domain-containing protein [Frankia sp.]
MSDESGRSATGASGTIPSTRPAASADEGDRRRRESRLPSVLSLIRLTALLVFLAVVAGAIGLAAGWRPNLNPFREETIDRTGPAVLRSLEDLSEYHAASAHFEVVVDLEEDTRWIPDALKGERVLFVGVGEVDGVVDFTGLDEDRITISEDRNTVTIRLPEPRLSEPRLDPERSYVVARQRGALDRIGGLFGGQSTDQDLYVRATDQIRAAAAEDGQVLRLARQNTTAMLSGLLRALGFTDVAVIYEPPAT